MPEAVQRDLHELAKTLDRANNLHLVCVHNRRLVRDVQTVRLAISHLLCVPCSRSPGLAHTLLDQLWCSDCQANLRWSAGKASVKNWDLFRYTWSDKQEGNDETWESSAAGVHWAGAVCRNDFGSVSEHVGWNTQSASLPSVTIMALTSPADQLGLLRIAKRIETRPPQSLHYYYRSHCSYAHFKQHYFHLWGSMSWYVIWSKCVIFIEFML